MTQDKVNNEPLEHWVRVPIVQKNGAIGPIYHWVKEGEEKKLYHGEKFNVETDILGFSEEEFGQLSLRIEGLTYGKVKEIFGLLERFNLNFVVVHDRMESD